MAYGNYVNPIPLSDKFGTGSLTVGSSYGSTLPANIGTDQGGHGRWEIPSDTDVTLTTGSNNRVVYTDMRFDFQGIGNEDFRVPTTGGRHCTFKNSVFNVRNPGGLNQSNLFIATTGGNAAQSGWNNGNAGTSYSCNFENCMIHLEGLVNNVIPDVMADDVIDCVVDLSNYAATNEFASWSVKRDAVLRGTLFRAPRHYSNSAGSLVRDSNQIPGLVTMRAVPRQFSDMTLENVGIVLGQGGSFLGADVNWTEHNQNWFLSINTGASDTPTEQNSSRGFVSVGPTIWAISDSDNSATSDFASKVIWGGGQSASGQHLIQNYGWQPTSVNNFITQTPTQGVWYYVTTNMPGVLDGTYDGDTDFYLRFANTSAADDTELRINRFKTDTDGIPYSHQYSLDSGATWHSGFLNWTRMVRDTETGTNNTTTNFLSQSAGAGVIAMPIQAALKTGTTNDGTPQALSAVHNLYSKYDIRAYAQTNGTDTDTVTQNTLTNSGSDFGFVPIKQDTVCDPDSPWVRPSNISSTDRSDGSIITARFPASPTEQVSYNDCHDIMRYMWSNYQSHTPPTVTDGIARVRCLQIGFDSNGTRVIGAGTDSECYALNTANTHPLIVRDDEAVRGLRVDSEFDLGQTQLQGGSVHAGAFANPVTGTTNPTDPTMWPAQAAFRDMELSGEIGINPGNTNVYIVASNITRPASENLTIANRRAPGQTGQIILVGNWPTSTVYPTDSATAPVTLASFPVLTVANDLDTELMMAYGIATSETATPSFNPNSVQVVQPGQRGSWNQGQLPAGTRVVLKMIARGYNESALQNEDIIIGSETNTIVVAQTLMERLIYNKDVSLVDTAANDVQTVYPFYSNATALASVNNIDGSNQTLDSTIPFDLTTGLTKLYIGSPDSTQRSQSPEQLLGANALQSVRLLMDIKSAIGGVSGEGLGYLRTCVENRTSNIIGGFTSSVPYIDRRYVIFASRDTNTTPYVTGVVNNDGTLLEENEMSLLLTVSGRESRVRNVVNPGGISPATIQALEQTIIDAVNRAARRTQAKIDPLY